MYIFFYILLILIGMLARFIDRDFKYLKIQDINTFISTDWIINLRIYTTLCGILIFFIIENRKYNVENLLKEKYMDSLSIYYKKYIEEGFYKY